MTEAKDWITAQPKAYEQLKSNDAIMAEALRKSAKVVSEQTQQTDVERVARAISPYLMRSYSGTNPDADDQAAGRDTALHVASLALTAMRPAIDQEKIAEIKRAYEAWRAADTRCALLADPEDEGSPSDRQDAAEEAAWAWDQAASKFMWNADALLAMIGGGDE